MKLSENEEKKKLIKLKIHEKRLSGSLCDKLLWWKFLKILVDLKDVG